MRVTLARRVITIGEEAAAVGVVADPVLLFELIEFDRDRYLGIGLIL